ncbi:hypothetical protein ACP275_03G001100 [Erythranthe tilingii]
MTGTKGFFSTQFYKGEIAEMKKIGEGKKLVAILPAFLNALAGPGKGVYVVTVNDYLARRD